MKPEKSSRPKLPGISQEMKAWSAALASEIGGWPQVTTRSFFGFTALYRKERMFGALPRTRALWTANSLAFKLESAGPVLRARLEKDLRAGVTRLQKVRWFSFELSSDGDLHDALDWLGRAYEAARKGKKSR